MFPITREFIYADGGGQLPMTWGTLTGYDSICAPLPRTCSKDRVLFSDCQSGVLIGLLGVLPDLFFLSSKTDLLWFLLISVISCLGVTWVTSQVFACSSCHDVINLSSISGKIFIFSVSFRQAPSGFR